MEQELLKKIKLVCSDVDGTLVEEGKADLNSEYYDQIRRLKEKGIMFAVISGRSYEATSPLFEPVINDILFINDNGSAIRYQGKLIRAHSIKDELAREIIREIEERQKGSTYISALTGSYACKENQDLCEILRTDFRLNVKELEHMPEDLPENAGVMGIALYDPVDAEKAAGEAFSKKWNSHEEIEALCGGRSWFNILQKNVDKGTALAEVMEELGLEKEEVIAIGDNMNDYKMLSSIPNSVAIGNARQEIKDICRYVADTNVNDGVLKILKML